MCSYCGENTIACRIYLVGLLDKWPISAPYLGNISIVVRTGCERTVCENAFEDF